MLSFIIKSLYPLSPKFNHSLILRHHLFLKLSFINNLYWNKVIYGFRNYYVCWFYIILLKFTQLFVVFYYEVTFYITQELNWSSNYMFAVDSLDQLHLLGITYNCYLHLAIFRDLSYHFSRMNILQKISKPYDNYIFRVMKNSKSIQSDYVIENSHTWIMWQSFPESLPAFGAITIYIFFHFRDYSRYLGIYCDIIYILLMANGVDSNFRNLFAICTPHWWNFFSWPSYIFKLLAGFLTLSTEKCLNILNMILEHLYEYRHFSLSVGCVCILNTWVFTG